MLRLLSYGNSVPTQYPVNTSATFQSGSAATLTVIGSQIVATPSDGMSFLGIFDDVKTTSFSAISWDEEIVITPDPGNIILNGSNQLTLISDVRTELENPNVDANYFVSKPVPVQLIPRNGVIVFPAGTVLNYDLAGTGTPDSIKTIVRYPYQIPNVIGDDTTLGSKMATVWFERVIFETDQFEANQEYRVMSNLYVNETGLFTTRKIFEHSPVVAICLGPPSYVSRNLTAMLL